MATEAHCLYCFEVLAASLDRWKSQKALTLAQVESQWRDYQEFCAMVDEHADEIEMTDTEDEMERALEEVDTDEADEDDENQKDPIESSKALAATLRSSNSKEPSNDRLAPPSNSHLRRNIPSPSSASSSSTPSIQSKSSGGSSTATQESSVASSRTNLSQIEDAQEPKASYSSAAQSPIAESPMFVTWNIQSRSTGAINLRGCIGTFEKQPLEGGLQQYALTSAFEDTRFNPIAASELPRLSCAVILLTDFERCANPMDWTLGTHGIRIAFTWHGKRYGATYLPHVAEDQGWNKVETLVSLMRKAGWNGSKNDWEKVLGGNGGTGSSLGLGRRGDVAEVIRYQGRKVGVDYDTWNRWRSWRHGGM